MPAELMAHRRQHFVCEVLFSSRSETLIKRGTQNGSRRRFFDRRHHRPSPFTGIGNAARVPRQVGLLVHASAPGFGTTVAAAGYVAHDGITYFEKRHLRAGERRDPVDEVGGLWIAEEQWSSIGGMETEKELIERRVVLPLAHPEQARRHGVVPASAIVLFTSP